ncbi:AAA family ATPase [Mycobacterium intracellulare]|uniref:AAA family ATPase n=1 Tax=Mycobacterium intracellulare TaxID=1767 RepID=UPI000CE4F2CD|nr:AAA family ATPase [Mycobacterium intracellulare]
MPPQKLGERQRANPLLKPFDVPKLLEKGVPPVRWHGVPGLFLKGYQGAFNGSSESGKTILKMDLAVHMTARIMPIGLPGVPEGDELDDDVRLLYIDWENPPRLTLQRFGLIFKDLVDNRGEDFDPARIFEKKLFYRPFPNIAALNTPEGAGRVLDFIDTKRINFVIIDTLSKATEGDENNSGSYTDLANYLLKDLRAAGITSVWGDHLGHADKRARGSSAKKDNWDFGWNVDAKKRNRDSGITEIKLVSDAKNRSGDLPSELWVTRHGKPLPYIRHEWEGATELDGEAKVIDMGKEPPQSVKVKQLLREHKAYVLTLRHRGKPSVTQIREWLKKEHKVTLRDGTVNNLIKEMPYIKELLFDDEV